MERSSAKALKNNTAKALSEWASERVSEWGRVSWVSWVRVSDEWVSEWGRDGDRISRAHISCDDLLKGCLTAICVSYHFSRHESTTGILIPDLIPDVANTCWNCLHHKKHITKNDRLWRNRPFAPHLFGGSKLGILGNRLNEFSEIRIRWNGARKRKKKLNWKMARILEKHDFLLNFAHNPLI